MKVVEALPYLDVIILKPLISILPSELLSDLKTNKGNTGQLLERLIGLQNSAFRLDFEDGELKTNKCDRYGKPKETMFITQISTWIDDILQTIAFVDSILYQKIKNMVYVPICKDGKEATWMFLPYIHVDLTLSPFKSIRIQIEKDYYHIATQLKNHILNGPDGFIHTSNGEYIQIRSKDSKPYHPIYSKVFKKQVSNKNHAFYFKKEFMIQLQQISPKYPLK